MKGADRQGPRGKAITPQTAKVDREDGANWRRIGCVTSIVDALAIVDFAGGARSLHARGISRRSRTSFRCRQAVVRVADGRQQL